MIVRRYLAREIIVSAIFVLLAFLLLFGFLEVVGELENINSKGYQLQQVLYYVFLNVPQHVYELLPIAALIGAVYALAQMAARSEFTILRMSGLDTRMLIGLLLQVGIPFAVLTFAVGEWVAPEATRYAEQYRMQAREQMVAQDFRTGLWIRDSYQTPEGRQTSFINFGQVHPDNSIDRIRIYSFDAGFRLQSYIEAESGEYLPPNQWRLKNSIRTDFDNHNPAEPVSGLKVTKIPEQIWQSRLHPDILGVLLVSPEKMSALSLVNYIRHLKSNLQKTNRYEIAFWNKIAYPLALFVMITLALPFAYLHVRAGSVSLKIFTGIMIGVFFHLLNSLFWRVGVLNTWPPFLTAILPGVLMLMLTLAALRWVERR